MPYGEPNWEARARKALARANCAETTRAAAESESLIARNLYAATMDEIVRLRQALQDIKVLCAAAPYDSLAESVEGIAGAALA